MFGVITFPKSKIHVTVRELPVLLAFQFFFLPEETSKLLTHVVLGGKVGVCYLKKIKM